MGGAFGADPTPKGIPFGARFSFKLTRIFFVTAQIGQPPKKWDSRRFTRAQRRLQRRWPSFRLISPPTNCDCNILRLQTAKRARLLQATGRVACRPETPHLCILRGSSRRALRRALPSRAWRRWGFGFGVVSPSKGAACRHRPAQGAVLHRFSCRKTAGAGPRRNAEGFLTGGQIF